MALEYFKTQVLLLHSQQDILDNLSASFNERYTVHCATSGSEALSTLAETPIHVIVSAQALPGMNGADALREAKRRSPDTVGILLAGNEASVGDEELFQIVRGSITPNELLGLIDTATQQSRLLALAESANDTTADADDTVAEHIVMETAEDGATIITDNTGRLPILNTDVPDPSLGANESVHPVDILVLTKDEQFAGTIRSSSRGQHTVHFANTIAKADEIVKNHTVGVAVVDAGMVGPNIEKLTLHLRTIKPRLVAIVAGRRDDGEMLMDLINRGKVYRFLLKPVSPGRVRLAVEASIRHHLEAPDTAFAIVAGATSTEATVTASRRPAPNPQEASPKESAPPPAQSEGPAQIASKPVAKPAPAIDTLSIADQLSDAFDAKDMSFTETMTGIVTSVGESVAGIRNAIGSKAKEAPELPTLRDTVSTTAVPTKLASTKPMPTKTDSGSSSSIGSKLLRVAVVVVVVIVAAGLMFWNFNRTGGTDAVQEQLAETPSVSETARTSGSPAPAEFDVSRSELLAEARLARNTGRIFGPPGSNAIELYMAAAAASPDDVVIAEEMSDVVDQALASAESAVLERRTDSASNALLRVALADPDNTRLPFLNAQVAQMQLKNFLVDARLAIRESRFEDAAIILTDARALGASDAAEIDLVESELDDARSEQRVDDLLARAAASLDAGKLIAPSNENARYYYELALSNDPENAAARQGLSVIANKLVLRARTEIDKGNFGAAKVVLANARKLDPSSSAVAESLAALGATQDRNAQAALDEANRKAAAEKRAAEQRAAVEKAAAQRATAELVAAENSATESSISEISSRPIDDAAAIVEAEPEAAIAMATVVVDDAAEDVPVPEATVNAVESDNTPAETQFLLNDTPVTVSSLTRTKYVAPKYPRSAQRRNISGWVDVVFVVDTDGAVTDVVVSDSEPGDTFVSAATKAVERWEFEPIIENAVAVPKRTAVRMLFAVE